MYAFYVKLFGFLSPIGHGSDLPGGGHLHSGLDYLGDSGTQGIRRHGRVQFRGQQHIRRDRGVSSGPLPAPGFWANPVERN